MPRSGQYVDNAQNRALGRVGMAYGTAVHSSSGGSSMSSSCSGISGGFSFSTGSSGSYVDNSQNRALGRVGMAYGTAVQSKSSGGSGSSRPSSGHYVDNAQNRALDRVGMAYGTAVQSKSSGGSGSSRPSSGHYVDNAQNRALGRVGMAYGTAVQSKSKEGSGSSRPSTGHYVDNAQNRALGRVGMAYGTAVQSKSSEGSCSSRSDAASSSSGPAEKRHVDNALNRKLGRVGMLHGECVQTNAGKKKKCYVDNAFNRKHGRVGLPLGSKPISKTNKVYRDNEINRRLNRVGRPQGSCPDQSNVWGTIYKELEDAQVDRGDDFPPDIYDLYENAPPDMRDKIECAMEYRNREAAVEEWLDETEDVNWQPHERTSAQMIKNCQSRIINFENLKIIDNIGHGGFGDVYIAELNGECVAVKVLRDQKLTKRHAQKFANEVQIFCDLEHANVVRFIGACVKSPKLAIVMEYMDMSLFDAIYMKMVDFDDFSVKKIVQDMACGLAYLHSKSIAHCDMKSKNVLLINVPGQKETDSQYPVLAKLTDFGLSKMKSNTETSTSCASGLRGTPIYAAPEVLRGEMLDMDELKAADVYSLGLVIYELAVQEVPFEGLSLLQLIEQVGNRGLSPLEKCKCKLNRYMETIFMECFSKEAHKRPSAQAMVRIAACMTTLLDKEEE